ncbi:SMODS domain-containing nucleotidyltransferase [Mucilaginibacter boryungensis]|uniref:Nucleotidyltransferase n=1 Tax=Mucilaginibacter boryungensis TaxID=768480 RepID=A0ABR9XLJ4_9SPHI|nr:nucleotidyltransferase domain-containing protein [Mucilaginibacter boryungensis]MBE9668092.1 nucleotidyltransferase [Mucilaginibacter boryungensis]
MSINNRLTQFAQKQLVLAHNKQERAAIIRSLDNLERSLDDEFGDEIEEFLRFGSFTRNTILPRSYDPNSDVDLMVVFNSADGLYAPSTYRKWIRDFLTVAYPKSISKKDFPAVILELNHIKFDIVPAYTTSNLLFGTRFYIPGRDETWRLTSPNEINSKLATKNKTYGDNIIRNVVRLCKHWNAGFGYPFQSYLLERQIIDLIFWGNENTYSRFLKTIEVVGADFRAVKNAVYWIKEYGHRGDEYKQAQWIRKLLPGFPY